MSLSINHVDLSFRQRAALGDLLPLGAVKIEQIKEIGASRTRTTTYVRIGRGKQMREWLLRKNGECVENPTPGKGRMR